MTPFPIAAFDVSLSCTGVCTGFGVMGNGTVSSRLEPPKTADRGMRRLQWIKSNVMAIADKVQLVVIEGYSFASTGRAGISLGELGGVIRLALWERLIPYVEIAPTSRAMFATGKGNAKKDEVFAAAIRRLGYLGTSNDEADALWLYKMASVHYSGAPVTQAQQRALDGVEWPDMKFAAAVCRDRAADIKQQDIVNGMRG